MNNETRLTGWLEALGEREGLEAPPANGAWVPTPDCPPLPRFLAAVPHQDWSLQELSHLRGCLYCQNMEKKVRQELGRPAEEPQVAAGERTVRPMRGSQMSTVYGKIALRAWEMATQQGLSPPDAWRAAICEHYADLDQQKNALRHTCPRGAFLGLCQRGFVRGIDPGPYTRSADSSGYGLAAVGLLQAEPDLAEDKSTLEKRVFGTRKPNDEVDVVLALCGQGLIQ